MKPLQVVRWIFSPRYRRRLHESKGVRSYLAASPDNGLLLLHDLPPGAIVMDIGGYTGEWTAGVALKYDARFFVFEPVPAFVKRLGERFAGDRRIDILDYGVGASDQRLRIGLSGDASSVFRDGGGQSMEINIRGIERIMNDLALDRVGLVMLNAEGAEFELLECLLDTGLINRFDRLLVQFHRVVDQAEERRAAIQQRMAATHLKIYDFPFAWEYWSRRGA